MLISLKKGLIFLFFLAMLIYAFPTYSSNIQPGLDASWAYAINLGFAEKWRWGSDVVFTFGPIGFLFSPQNVGINRILGYWFWGIIYLLNTIGIFLVYREKKNQFTSARVGISACLFIFSTYIFNQADYYLIYVAIIFCSLTWWGKGEKITNIYWALANSIFFISFFLKLSTAMIIGSLIFLMLIFFIIQNRKYMIKCVIFFGVCVGILGALYIYTGGIHNTYRYVRGALDISSGYNIAMSSSAYDKIMPIALGIILIYLMISVIFYFRQEKDKALYCLSFIGAIFFCYKHGFVRADSHVFLFFFFMVMLFSVQLLFIDYDDSIQKYKRTFIAGITSVALLYIILVISFYLKFEINLLSHNQLYTKGESIKNYSQATGKIANKEDILPTDFMEEIGDSTVSIFPWEIVFAAYNDIHYEPMPVFQTYSAYTPYLDKLNAEFLSSINAPKYIIFQYKSIDGRNPLLDVPSTWQSINNYYKVIQVENNIVLLEKIEKKYKTEKFIKTIKSEKDSLIELPQTDKLLVGKFNFKLNWAGKIMSFIYKIPEVYIEILGKDGKVCKYRVIPENLENGIIVNNIPDNISELINLENMQDTERNDLKVQFSGKGLKYYNNLLLIDYLELNTENEVYNKYKWNYKSDFLSPKEEISLPNSKVECTGFVDYVGQSDNCKTWKTIKGWINVNGKASKNQKVLVELKTQNGNKFFLAKQTSREDVAEYFKSEQFIGSGFEVTIDTNEFHNLVEKSQVGRIFVEYDNFYYDTGLNFEFSNSVSIEY